MAAALLPVEADHDRYAGSTDQIGAEITELCACLYAATYRLLTLIRDFDEQEGWQAPGLCSCAHWLNFKCGIGMSAAREKVRVAHALKALPKISAAFGRGELSYSKVRAMTRIADQENENYLLMIARHGTAWHMEKLVQKFRRAERLADAEYSNRQHRERYLEHFHDEDGCVVINARLPAEQGALVVKALEKALVQATRDVRQNGHDRADVSAETSDTEPASDPISARRADALAELAETNLASASKTGSSADRYQVVLHVSAETSGQDGEANSYIENGPHVSAETSLTRIRHRLHGLSLVHSPHSESVTDAG